MNQEQREILMIGPVLSGKTCFLSTLELAAQKHNARRTEDYDVFVQPATEPMINLFRQCRETIRNEGRFPINASMTSQEYSFTLELRQRGWFKRMLGVGDHVLHFNFLDSPGGASIGGRREEKDLEEEIDYAEIEAHKQKVIDSLGRAWGLLIFVDANDQDKAADFFVALPDLLARVGMRTLPIQRIAICLTKADKYFVSQGRDALNTIRCKSPLPLGIQILTQPGLQSLRSYCRPYTKIMFGWASTYGFIENQGNPNYDPHKDRLLMFEGLPSGKVIEYWEPFRVLEPFIYMANGECQNLEAYK